MHNPFFDWSDSSALRRLDDPSRASRRRFLEAAGGAIVGAALTNVASAQDPQQDRRRRTVIESTMFPYDGKSILKKQAEGLDGKVLAGYQGWFCCEGDGMNVGWSHYAADDKRLAPGHCSFELWPDLSEFDADERFATNFSYSDGSKAHLFSSCQPKTVKRHFQWMREYGIDGAIVNRFPLDLQYPEELARCNIVLNNVRHAANQAGRCYALMYDMSQMEADKIVTAVRDDWALLVESMGISRSRGDLAYLRYKGKPLIGLWGLGFAGTKSSSEAFAELVDFLKKDRVFGGNAILIGVPTWWRTLDRDCQSDRRIHDVLAKADVLLPWTPSRFHTLEAIAAHRTEGLEPDLAWCTQRKLAYCPVISPGFSEHNRAAGGGREAPWELAPRQGGKYLWQQAIEAKRAKATMTYVAMFDELNEATAILKCTNDPPQGRSRFLTYENLSSDHYLWLSGEVGKMLRSSSKPSDSLPNRK
jgi:hypothetical protein